MRTGPLRSSRFAAGAWLAGAIAIKIIPAFLLVYPLWKRDWRWLGGSAAGCVLGLFILPAAVVGPGRTAELYRDWVRQVVRPGLTEDVGTDRSRELLGMTATPERTDGFNVFEIFDYNVPYEIRLNHALEEDMLAPFHYYGVADLTYEDGRTTTEDADFLRRNAVLDDDRITAVRTGCCPHTAIRDDISANLDAVEDLEDRHGSLELVIVESGGDNLTATFSQGLVDRQIFVLDVSGGDKVPRKGGPGVTTSDLLVINKTDLAPLVGADLAVMDRDSARVREGRPVIFNSIREEPSVPEIADWVRSSVHDFRHH